MLNLRSTTAASVVIIVSGSTSQKEIYSSVASFYLPVSSITIVVPSVIVPVPTVISVTLIVYGSLAIMVSQIFH